jgi:hypothetical protein
LQDLVRLFQEDRQQLGVDFFVRRFRQLLCFRRRQQNFRGLRRQCRQCGIHLAASQITGLQGLQRRLGAFAQGVVGHQIGILLDGLEILLEFFLQALVLRCLFRASTRAWVSRV